MAPEAQGETRSDLDRGIMSGRTKATLIVLTVSLVVTLSTTFYFIICCGVEDSPMTMTLLVDRMSDTNGNGIPNDYMDYDEGDNVTIRDQLIGYEYVDAGDLGLSYSLLFPYSGMKWKDLYGILGFVYAVVITNSSLCAYGYGDWITLTGAVEAYEVNGTRREFVNWTVFGDPGPFGVPSIGLSVVQVSNATWRIVPSNCTANCKLWHFDFVLRKYGLGMDVIRRPEHGERSIYMEFWDIDKDGCLGEGDVLYVMPHDEGDYEVAVFYHSDELTGVSWQHSP